MVLPLMDLSGFDGTEANPDIYVIRGQKYRFKKDFAGHPFAIQKHPWCRRNALQ